MDVSSPLPSGGMLCVVPIRNGTDAGERAIQRLLTEAECREADLRHHQQQLVQAARNRLPFGELATGNRTNSIIR